MSEWVVVWMSPKGDQAYEVFETEQETTEWLSTRRAQFPHNTYHPARFEEPQGVDVLGYPRAEPQNESGPETPRFSKLDPVIWTTPTAECIGWRYDPKSKTWVEDKPQLQSGLTLQMASKMQQARMVPPQKESGE